MKKFWSIIALLGMFAISANAVTLHYEYFETGESNGDAVLQQVVGDYFNEVYGIPAYFAGREDSSTDTLGLTVLTDPTGFSGTWTYTAPLENVLAYVLKAGTEGWMVHNVDLSLFESDVLHNWTLPIERNSMSYLAVFSDRPQTVPEPGSTLASLVAGLGFLGFARSKFRV